MFLKSYPTQDEFEKLKSDFGVVPVCEEILADSETPVSLLRKFFHHDPAKPIFLLESVEGGERWGRYSFLGLGAYATIRVYSEYVEIEKSSGTEQIKHGGKPLDTLREMMKEYTPANIGELPRLWGGLVGYFTFESVSFFEPKIPNKLPEGTPLARFVIPQELLAFDNLNNSLNIIAFNYCNNGEAAEKQYKASRRRIRELVAFIESSSSTPNDEVYNNFNDSLKPLISEDEYRDKVKSTIEKIYDGEIIQAVIAQKFTCKAPDNLIALYRAQRYINPSPYMYFFSLDGKQIIGSSPETLVRLEGDKATVRPIAGSRPRGNTEQEDRALADELLQDEKERAEHLMLVDLGRNDLGRVAVTGTVQVTDMMFIERYSHIMHLVSNVECNITPDCDAFDLFAATFPAGTLSGAPKVRAMEIISETEDFARDFYGGALGYISFNGNMDFAITIRTASVENDELTVIAGGGIVYDSNPETERQESVNKAGSINKALNMLKTSNELSNKLEEN